MFVFVILTAAYWLVGGILLPAALAEIPPLKEDVQALFGVSTLVLSILAAIVGVILVRWHDEERDHLKAAQAFLKHQGGGAVNEAMRWKAEEVARLFNAAESIRHENARVSGPPVRQDELIQAQQAFEKAHAEFRQFQAVLNEANILCHATVEEYLNWPDADVPVQQEERTQAAPSDAIPVAQT